MRGCGTIASLPKRDPSRGDSLRAFPQSYLTQRSRGIALQCLCGLLIFFRFQRVSSFDALHEALIESIEKLTRFDGRCRQLLG